MSQRNTSLDAIRVFAVFTVISVHYFLNCGFYNAPVIGKRMMIMTIARQFFMICVPLFIMLTGYLMSSKKLNKRYYLGIKKTLFTYIMASIICVIFKVTYLNKEYTVKTGILSILDFSASTYSWYIEMYIGLFLLIPFLNLMYTALNNKRQKQIMLITFLLLTSLPTITNIYNFSLESWWRNPAITTEYQKILPDWWQGIYPLTYYFIGAYLKEYGLPISRKISFLVIMIGVGGGISFYRSYGVNFIGGPWTDYNSIIIVLMAVLVFQIFLETDNLNKLPTSTKNLLKLLSDGALGAYLLSDIFDSVIYPYMLNRVYEFNYMFEYYFIVVPIVFACSMFSSWGIEFVYMMMAKLYKRIYMTLKVNDRYSKP